MSVEIIHDGFAPMDPSIEVLNVGDSRTAPQPYAQPYSEPLRQYSRNEGREPYDDRRNMPQRLSTVEQMVEVEEVRPRRSPSRRRSILLTRPKSISKPNFICYHVAKEGDDWQYARKSILPASQDEIEKKVRKGKGKVIDEMARMGSMRRQHIQNLVDAANDAEDTDASWNVAYIEVAKEVRKRKTREIKAMNVILAKNIASKPAPVRAKSRSRSVGNLMDALEPSKFKGKDKDEKKDKNDDGDAKSHKKHDSAIDFIDDPFGEGPLFDNTGKPMDMHGPIPFDNAGLPSTVPRDKPIGHRPEKKEAKNSRSKSRDKGTAEPLIDLGNPMGGEPFAALGDPLGGGPYVHGGAGSRFGEADTLDAILGEKSKPRSNSTEKLRGRRRRDASRPRADAVVEEIQRRSHSRRRPSEPSHSRPRSKSRPSSIRYPNERTKSYFGDSGGSSVIDSDESRYGDDYERSSRTSFDTQDTHEKLTRRGSLYHQDRYPAAEKEVYQQHRKGPPIKRYSMDERDTHVVLPHRPGPPRRASSIRYVPVIPETRRVDYREYEPQQELVRRRTYDAGVYSGPTSPRSTSRPVVLYPDEIEERVEGYMEATVREEFVREREKDLERREREQNDREFERRMRERERDYDPRPRRYERNSVYEDRGARYYYD